MTDNINSPNNKMKLIVCECCQHAMGVEHCDDEVYITLWKHSAEPQMNRLYWICQAMKGQQNDSEVVLGPVAKKQLIKALKKDDSNNG
jgi:late competence protein required for DNA uptake (superfamily II DNA/RNA helicase)